MLKYKQIVREVLQLWVVRFSAKILNPDAFTAPSADYPMRVLLFYAVKWAA